MVMDEYFASIGLGLGYEIFREWRAFCFDSNKTSLSIVKHKRIEICMSMMRKAIYSKTRMMTSIRTFSKAG